ncbi:hypothetical protein BESB_071700 [Besnoitia besnoiti]|uniref:Transmembrane protein n=1 Tax=Besnoitia besnoiti TaxID=94643 RepID=A0A2A9M6B9_BESBE|nr:uncharacterized protein BESB_071700 [Besnoitia besnoiti]PFH34018.1 hypothetical protein BESB_071700 [Besnoitia besnoiti]
MPGSRSRDEAENSSLVSSAPTFSHAAAEATYAPPPRRAANALFPAGGFMEPGRSPGGLANPPAENAVAAAERASQKIWRSYLYGQLANVTKAAVWWSMFGTLMISIVGNDSAVGITRAAFNLALVLVSPLAGAVAERASIRRLLGTTTVTRLLIWSAAVPAAWLFLKNDLDRPDLFLLCLVALMFFDGVQVAFANVVDIDCGGLDTLSAQYDLPVDDSLRNKMNGCHQMVFDLSFIVFTPPIAFGVYLLSLHLHHLLPDSWLPYLGSDSGVFALVSSMSFIFCVLSVVSLGCYVFGLPRRSARQFFYPEGGSHDGSCYEGSGGGHTSSAEGTSDEMASSSRGNRLLTDTVDNDSETSETQTDLSSVHTLSLFQETASRLEDVRDGLLIVLREKELGWRLVFLAFETALEDSMVSVVIPELALQCCVTAFATWGVLGGSASHGASPSSTAGAASVLGSGIADGFSVEGSTAVPLDAEGGGAFPVSSSSAFLLSAGDELSVSSFDFALGGLPPFSFFSLPSWDFTLTAAEELPLGASPNRAFANLLAVVIIAVGKIGGSLAGLYMNRRWTPPASYSRDSAYRRLFWCVLASSFSVALLPLSQFLYINRLAPTWLCAALVLLSAFAFFLFSTAPKIGFATLLQGLVASQQVACKVFGFVGTFVTVTDAVVIACINMVFTAFLPSHFLSALLCVTGVYLVHGLIEAFVGPLLILEPPTAGLVAGAEGDSGDLRGATFEARGREFAMDARDGDAREVAGAGVLFDASGWSAARPANRGGQSFLPPHRGPEDGATGFYWTGEAGASASGASHYPLAADQQQRGVSRRS